MEGGFDLFSMSLSDITASMMLAVSYIILGPRSLESTMSSSNSSSTIALSEDEARRLEVGSIPARKSGSASICYS